MIPVNISIVTASLNSERYFTECLESIHRQVPDGIRVQHIVVDGGSGDRTLELAGRYPCEIVCGQDEGLYDAMNIGIGRSTGDVVGILNSDDTLLPGALATVADWYRSRNSEWMVAGLRWTNGEGRSLGNVPAPPAWMSVEAFASLGWNCIHHSTSYMTREFCSRVGTYDLTYAIAADYDFFARALRLQPYDRIGRTLSTLRFHGENVSASSPSGLADENERILNLYGPRSAARRSVGAFGLRLWLNGMSPGWFAAKRSRQA